MKHATLILAATVLSCTVAAAQDRKEPAIVEEHTEVLTMSSAMNAIYKVSSRITVFREEGDAAAAFSETTDSYISLTSFNATVTVGGKKIKSKLSDLHKSIRGGSLVDDIVDYSFIPDVSYPYTVEYEYTMTYKKGVFSFPPFLPQNAYDVPVKSASYTLDIPEGTEIMYRAWQDPAKSNAKGRDIYLWEVKDVPALKHESMMPSMLEFIPYVYSAPTDFVYGGTTGNQSTWDGTGKWNASLFPSEELPEELRAKVLEMTSSCENDAARIRRIYQWLRDNTRYVSIQLGIGGFAPSAPSDVYRSGYGDCKALSFLMHSMLKAIGIDSRFVALSTNRASFPEGYSALGQMNHAMLCIPMQADSIWVECTNPVYPLGYRHGDIAGHQVLLVDKDRSELVRVPGYPDSLRCITYSTVLDIAADGSAHAQCSINAPLEHSEPYITIRNWETKQQMSRLTKGFRSSVQGFKLLDVKDNFQQWNGEKDYVPVMEISYELDSKHYCKVMGERLFVPVPVFSRAISVSRAERVHDMVVNNGGSIMDIVTVRIPEGYSVESMPKISPISTRFFDLEAETEMLPDGSIRISLKSVVKAGRFPKEAYEEYRIMARNVNRIFESSLVLSSATRR